MITVYWDQPQVKVSNFSDPELTLNTSLFSPKSQGIKGFAMVINDFAVMTNDFAMVINDFAIALLQIKRLSVEMLIPRGKEARI